MSTDPFTIKIFVPDGDPEGIRIVELMNWTGKGIVFPRLKWRDIKNREEFKQAGVYILVGSSDENDETPELPTVYIGQSDSLIGRLNSHESQKDFWDQALVFVSSNNSLNKGHTTWLEYALVKQANEINQCNLLNGNAPNEPQLSESEKADTQNFLKQILQILPLVGLRALEKRKAIEIKQIEQSFTLESVNNTVIVPAQKDGFEKVFMGEKRWHAIKISGGMLNKIKYIAAYQTAPVSAITHYAQVERIEPYGENGKYQLIFSEQAKEIYPIPFLGGKKGTMQSPRYAQLNKLLSAKEFAEIF